jgi:hypothetical protein
MKYMLFMSVDKSVQLDPEQRAAIPAAVEAWVAEMDARGVRLQGDVLRPISDAKTVRVRDGEVVTNDGVGCTNSIFPARAPIQPLGLTLPLYGADDAEKLRG